jgi:nicotinamidase-related amidase
LKKHSKMKKIIYSLLLISTAFIVPSCDVLENAAASLPTSTSAAPKLTNGEVVSGLKEALQVGIKNAVSLTSVTNGFSGNPAIRLPFPEDAMKVREKALDWGLDTQVEKFETTLNRAAEEATKEAMPIFMNAITNMSVQDGFAILNGGNGTATKFLRDNTSAQLVEAFSPKVADAISEVKLTEYWNPIITKYNSAMKFTGGQQLNPDLNQYVTAKAIDGLFLMVEKEENKIRLDPAARVTDLLSKVFSSVKP